MNKEDTSTLDEDKGCVRMFMTLCWIGLLFPLSIQVSFYSNFIPNIKSIMIKREKIKLFLHD